MQLPNSNSFHLERVKLITDNNQNELDKPVVETFKNETMVSLGNNRTDPHLTEKTPTNLKDTLSSIKSIDKALINRDEIKINGKQWRTSKNAVPAKPLNSRNITSHPKRESSNHPMWHKKLKDLHKLGTVNTAKGNGFNGFDVVLVGLPPSYSRLRWDKPRTNTFTTPSFRYMPVGPSPSIFDFFMGLNSISGNFLTNPDGSLTIQTKSTIGSMDQPSDVWNHRLSFDRLVSPATIHRTAMHVMNGERIPREDINATQLYGKLLEPTKQNCACTCGSRNKHR